MIRRFVQLKPGGQLSAAEINRAFEQIQRAATFTVAAPLELVQGAQGNLLRVRETTGGTSGGTDSFILAELTEDPAGNYLDEGGVYHEAGEDVCEPGDEARCDCPPNEEDPQYLPRGYGWRAVGPNRCGGFDAEETPFGTPCIRPLYDMNGNTIPLSTNGHPTRVKIWLAQPGNQLDCPDYEGYYLCDYQVGLSPACCAEGESEDDGAIGGTGFATPAACLFNCNSVKDGYWGVKIGGNWYPVCAINADGTPVTGDE